MINTGKLANRTAVITGASRGIGKAIALKFARDGGNVVIFAKTAKPHPKLPGTIYDAAEEIEKCGGKALPCEVDVRDAQSVSSAVEAAVRKFGGIDVVINNASAISLTGTESTPSNRYDLMNNVNARGTFITSQACIPYLKQSKNPHILNLSPPLDMDPKWFKNHCAYTISKYGMSMCAIGMAAEFKGQIAVNALWPKTAIFTAAVKMLTGSEAAKHCRKPDIMADAAYAIVTKKAAEFTGNCTIDEDVLADAGVTDFERYACEPGNLLLADAFINIDHNDPKFITESIFDVSLKSRMQ
ncbi:uncharacterized protein TRIADDRAFT_58889 [Trichoplax adhaerens]|uniref:Hydroxysteroid dehydrogenase-like protein 2 n=1 Tax=Trichoplax adhaerens TaxID=10228 RepID=B3S3Y5_TRIAD|nr:hypothetical protein TRIADDRAFT_58889 [Trichoplax adhaerens]EDV22360.1 hypothetical protein TRIADDRAFT_58889 [Trichoplax adhaerens]|eukprot:XP_002114904.1 hypothetical protein TRIADDRAFT_58889 [Trichoplax adhaerens]